MMSIRQIFMINKINIMGRGAKKLLLCGSALSTLLASSAAVANIEELVVTAQKRAQSINDVPIAINALSGDMLEENGISDTDDIIESFPNLGLNVRSAYNSGVSIRGVGTDNIHISAQQSVGTYIDDVSIVSPFVSTIGVFDMERVEVLRGPQNTLYGRNTTGGAIVWHTRKANPSDGVNGYASVGAGSGNLLEFEGAVGFDLSENFAVRISAMKDKYDGIWQDVVTGADTGGGYDRYGVRINLQWDISPDTSLNVGLSKGETDGEDTAYTYRGNRLADGQVDPTLGDVSAESTIGVNNNFVAVSAAQVDANPFLAEQFAMGTGMVIVNPTPGPNNRLINYSTAFGTTYVHPDAGYEADWDGIRANLTHSFETIDLTLLGSYDETSLSGANIADLTGFGVFQLGKWEVVQLEARLASTGDGDFRWIAGVYYSDENSQQDTWVQNGGAAGGQGVVPGIDIDSNYRNISVYGQVDYQITDDLNATIGVRYTDDKLATPTDGWVRTVCGFSPSVNGVVNITREVREAGCPGFAPGQLGPTRTQSPSQELSKFGWKAGLNYDLSEQAMVYFSVSKGFKGGAYDNRPLAIGDNPIGPEDLTAYELGFKATLADNRIQLNGALFRYDWVGLQLFDIIGGNAVLLNIPKTELTGAELDLQFSPNDSLFFQAAVGYVSTEVVDDSDLPVGSTVDIGDEVTNTPKFTANLSATYTTEVGSGELSFTTSWRYASEYFYTFDQTPGRNTAPSQDYLNASITFAYGDELQHSLRLYGTNLTEEFHCSGLQNGPAGGQNYSCRVGSFGQAEFGFTLRTEF